jgi:uncharacterized membrane protein HdeD (DUF308 family)
MSKNPVATDRVVWLSIASSVLCVVAFFLLVKGSGALATMLAVLVGVAGIAVCVVAMRDARRARDRWLEQL